MFDLVLTPQKGGEREMLAFDSKSRRKVFVGCEGMKGPKDGEIATLARERERDSNMITTTKELSPLSYGGEWQHSLY